MQLVLVALGCNNTCVFCAQGALRESEGERGDLESSVVAAARTKQPVAFVGGEPTLVPDLPDLIRLARAEGAPAVVVQTNGRRLAYASYAQALKQAGATAVDVSLHGSTAAMHDFHTGVAGSFAQTATGLGVARAAGLRVGVTTVVTRSNFRHLNEVVRLVHARGVRLLQLSSAKPIGRALSAPAVVPAAEMVGPALAEAARLGRSLGLELLIEGAASHPALLEVFAGLGTVEPPPSTPETEGAAPRPLRALPVVGAGRRGG